MKARDAMRRTYTIVLEKGPKNYGAYVLDLPGCVAVAKTAAEARRLIREAIVFHLEGMRERGEKLPRARSKAETVELELV